MLRTLRIVGWLVVLECILLGMLVMAVLWGTAVGVTTYFLVLAGVIAGLLPIVASLVATCDPRTAARMILWATPLAPFFALLFSSHFGGILCSLALFTGVIVIPGCFWYAAARRNWPPPLSDSFMPRRRSLRGVFGVVLTCFFIAGSFVWSLALPWWPLVGDCGGLPVLDEQGHPLGIDFTAKILFVGPRTFHGFSLWSIARVEQRFSGSSWWPSNIVILRGTFKPTDTSAEYFVEGARSVGALTRLLPLIERLPCGHTGTRNYAAVAIRILRDGAPKAGVRLIGRVYTDDQANRLPAPGVGISIDGPSESTVSSTDADGIYDASGLPPGRYTLHLAANSANGRSMFGVKTPVFELKAGEIGGADFYLR